LNNSPQNKTPDAKEILPHGTRNRKIDLKDAPDFAEYATQRGFETKSNLNGSAMDQR